MVIFVLEFVSEFYFCSECIVLFLLIFNHIFLHALFCVIFILIAL